ncbi:ABC transporter ATP-binding protein [Ruegeria arenilitoris]|uniref:ABC transporter ATP-binding protein n=1 Tax=Ruegeria arenilitoris TaxID=1173585 RepID=UPI00147BF43E|nr:ABC transporter ATP-binding protein [Ruegeria arenilitoris]
MYRPILATHGLTKSFGALNATRDVSVDLNSKEIHAIIGPNGAGKSTLIKQICGEMQPDSGRVTLDGQDVSKLSTFARARAGLGRTFQVSDLCMEDTVMENVVLGSLGAEGAVWRFWKSALKTRDLCERAERALERVGLIEERYTRCANLSHGQRRQLEVAVALTLSPRAFIMDEPMAGLGVEGSKQMTSFLDGLRKEAPILLVEHDMDAVFALADRISVMVYGKVIATGTPNEIRNRKEVREAYLGDAV